MTENDRIPFMQTDEQPQAAEPSSGGLLLKSLGALILVVGLIFVAAWVAKKAGFGGSKVDGGTHVEVSVLSSVPMGNGRSLSTIRFNGRTLLVGVTAQAFTLLAEDDAEVGESFIRGSRSVAEMLADEDATFGDRFDVATANLSLWKNGGESA